MPVCVCKGIATEMRCTKNGVAIFSEGSDNDNVRTQSGDKFVCPKCGAAIITSFGDTYYSKELSVARELAAGGFYREG